MKPFRRRRRGWVIATFDPDEANVLVSLAGQIVELLRDRNGAEQSSPDPLGSALGVGGPSQRPDDPVLQRLLPDAYADDAEEAAEFRRFTERSLTSTKVDNAEQLIGSFILGGFDSSGPPVEVEVELDHTGVQAWLRALTDIRLAVAIRMGIETDEDVLLAQHSDDPDVRAMCGVYDWLGYVQESLVLVLD